jgi:hypothetical protein
MKDDFEEQLKSQPFRQVPEQWREEILAAGRAGCPKHAASSTEHFVRSWWRELLWPCPQAWAALAAVWIVLLVIHFETSEPAVTKMAKARPATVSRQMLAVLQEQRRLYTELIESAQVKEEDTKPRPHTEMKIEAVYV